MCESIFQKRCLIWTRSSIVWALFRCLGCGCIVSTLRLQFKIFPLLAVYFSMLFLFSQVCCGGCVRREGIWILQKSFPGHFFSKREQMLVELSVRGGGKLWSGNATILSRSCSETLLNTKPQLLATTGHWPLKLRQVQVLNVVQKRYGCNNQTMWLVKSFFLAVLNSGMFDTWNGWWQTFKSILLKILCRLTQKPSFLLRWATAISQGVVGFFFLLCHLKVKSQLLYCQQLCETRWGVLCRLQPSLKTKFLVMGSGHI